MQLASKPKPFLLSAGIYGGGGFLGIQTRADTLELLEASFEYGLVTGFAFGPVTGSGRITAGVYIRMGGRNPCIEGFFCAAGECSVAGIITVSAALRVFLTYRLQSKSMEGNAEFEFKFSLGIVDYSYRAGVSYATKGDAADGKQALLRPATMLAAAGGRNVYDSGAPLGLPYLDPIEPDDAFVRDDCWQQYWRIFADSPVVAAQCH
jgi:hypothetical protein